MHQLERVVDAFGLHKVIDMTDKPVPEHNAPEPIFSFSNQLQTCVEAGISLSLMECDCGSEHRGMPDNRVSHTDGGVATAAIR